MNRNRHTAEGGVAQGHKTYSRREALGAVAALGLVSSSFAARVSLAAPPSGPSMRDLIDEHRVAMEAWNTTLSSLSDAQDRLFDSLRAEPIECALKGFEKVVFRLNKSGCDPLEVAYEQTERCIRSILRVRSIRSPSDLTSLLADASTDEVANIEILKAGNLALDDRERAVGLAAAEEAEAAAGHAERIARHALIKHRPSSIVEATVRFQYLLSEMVWRDVQPEADELEALFVSMSTPEASA